MLNYHKRPQITTKSSAHPKRLFTGFTAMPGIRQIGFCLLFCFLLTGCDVLYRMLHKEGAEERAIIGDIIPFEKNPVVEEVQALLSIYGYSPGKIDGVMGLQTRNAIEEFQRDNGLKETRFVDRATWEKLMVFKENNLVVKNKLNIKLVQAALKEAGFDPGAIDGKMGTKTKNAILAFQRAKELTADGKIGYKTLAKLSEVLPALPAQQEAGR